MVDLRFFRLAKNDVSAVKLRYAGWGKQWDEWAKIEIDEEELRKAVIAGHVANFRKTPHGTLLKTTAAAEARTYKAFEAAKSPVARLLPEHEPEP